MLYKERCCKRFRKIHSKTPVLEILVPVNLAKFLRTSFLHQTPGWLLLVLFILLKLKPNYHICRKQCTCGDLGVFQVVFLNIWIFNFLFMMWVIKIYFNCFFRKTLSLRYSTDLISEHFILQTINPLGVEVGQLLL